MKLLNLSAVGIPVLNVPDLADLQKQQGVAMLMVKTPPGNFEEIDKKEAKKEKVEHKGTNHYQTKYNEIKKVMVLNSSITRSVGFPTGHDHSVDTVAILIYI